MQPPAQSIDLRGNSDRRLTGLDALRGIAALCVVSYHVLAAEGATAGKGYLAVDFFLMLSGYVLARTYEGRMANGLGPFAFFAARYRRLWPMMAVGTLLGLLLLGGASPLIVMMGLLLLPLFQTGYAFPLNSPAWSVALELVLNVLHAAVFHRVSNRALAIAVVTGAVATLPFLAAGHGLEGGPSNGAFGFALLRGLISYPLGIILWRVWRDRPPLRIPAAITVAAMPALYLLSVFEPSAAVFDYAFVLLVCPLLIAGGLTLATRWGWFLGAVSFPLYAVHYPLIHWASERGMSPWSGALAAILAVAGGVGLSMLAARRRVDPRDPERSARLVAEEGLEPPTRGL
ncbi:acyltransferase family protein [Tsuneonella sp. HG222]